MDLDSGQPVADKLHRTVKACVQTQDTQVRGAMFAALQLDLIVCIVRAFCERVQLSDRLQRACAAF